MVTTSADVLAGELRLAVTRTARRLRQEAGGPLTPTLTAALATVDRHGPLTPSELARRECVQRPTATKLVARLEADGLVRREEDLFDRRSSFLTVTPAGAELLRAVRTAKDAFLADRLEALSAEERATLARAAVLLEALLES